MDFIGTVIMYPLNLDVLLTAPIYILIDYTSLWRNIKKDSVLGDFTEKTATKNKYEARIVRT